MKIKVLFELSSFSFIMPIKKNVFFFFNQTMSRRITEKKKEKKGRKVDGIS